MLASTSHAIILFAHGARDARWSKTLSALRERVEARLATSHVAIAFLEFQGPSLEEALTDAVAQGCDRIDIVPVFWASGGHVVIDLPPLLDRFRAKNPRVELTLLPVLSELPGLLDFVADVIVERRSQQR